MPYTRYDTEKASLAGGAVIAKSDSYSNSSIATQASNHALARLPKVVRQQNGQWKRQKMALQ